MHWDWRWLALIVGDVLIAVAGPVADSFGFVKAMPIGAAVVAVWTYLLVWLIQRDPAHEGSKGTVKHGEKSTTNSMRDAITATFIVTYLVLVSWTAFLHEEEGKPAGIATTFVSNFTFLTGIVVGFYFGTDAIRQVAQIRKEPRNDVPREGT
jgi:hypothetical protein